MLRISPAGDGFVLYQMPKREVTAVAVARDGTIYAAAVGIKQAVNAPAPTPAPQPPPPAATAVTTSPAAGQPASARPAQPPPPASSAPVGVSGGSDVFRIEPNGNPRRIWSHSQDVVYAIAFPVVAAGRTIIMSAAATGVPMGARWDTPAPAVSRRR